MVCTQFHSRKKRLSCLEDEAGISLSSIDHAFVDEEDVPRCENMIGAVSVPLGIAGPIHICSSIFSSKKESKRYIPLATTEGALVASVNRGCKVSRETDGIHVYVQKKGATRGPVFYTGSLTQSHTLVSFISSHEKEIKKTAEATSKHLRVLGIEAKVVGPYVFLRCSYDTDQAMGMNMVTIASQHIATYIEQHTDTSCLAVAGNYDIDKKPAWLNIIHGRGYEAWAEIIISPDIVQRILKTTPQQIYHVWVAKCMVGSAMSGSLGFNAHYANIVAAFYTATGQDIAHTGEGSLGITVCSLTDKQDISVSVYLPSLMLGVIGGGTKLKTQTEARTLTQAETPEELAAVLAGGVLAGELSLLSSLAEKSLARTHKKMGR